MHRAIKKLDRGVYPGAFCKAQPDIPGGNSARVFLMHSDGAGTKSSLAYMYWKETGDISVFRGIAQDALIMNIDDLLCVGAVSNFIVSSTIGRNKHIIPGAVISEIIQGTEETIQLLNSFGAQIQFAGGETADVGDLVRTVIVDSTVCASLEKTSFIDASNIVQGMDIIGFESGGQAKWEKQYNSGIGSNGLTSARHDIFSRIYAERYPETYDSATPHEYVYTGRHLLQDPVEGAPITWGQAILSPTRTYLPLVSEILSSCRKHIGGIIHCTGGGQTKCLKFSNNIHYIKNNLFPFTHLFKELALHTDMREMFQVFNCGHRMELYTEKCITDKVIQIAEKWGIQARIIGRTEAYSGNKLTIEYEGQEICYAAANNGSM